MMLQKTKSLIRQIESNTELKCIHIISTSEALHVRAKSSTSHFFRMLKNSLQSINGVSNRKYFNGLSGCYFSFIDSKRFEIIIVYDKKCRLTFLHLAARVKKILGHNTRVTMGETDDYIERIKQISDLRTEAQTFGEFFVMKGHKLISKIN
jgi:hypothetical protein